MRDPVILDARRTNPWTGCICTSFILLRLNGHKEARNVSIVKSSRAASPCGVAWKVASTIVFGLDRRSDLDLIESMSTIDARG
jgi:hypothetical protein